jgi:arylsulfatase A-like enzyme
MPYWKGKKNKRQHPMMFQFKNQYAVIDNDFKLYGTEETPPQLYNIAEDNAEAHDLSSQQQSPLSNLISHYNIWNQSVQNSALGGDY